MTEMTSHPHGTFCWAELGTTDISSAKRFYGELFDWGTNEVPMGEGQMYLMEQVAGRDAAAMYELSQEQLGRGIPPNWASYVAVDNVDAAAQKAQELGGALLMDPFDVMDVGRMAFVQDPSGAMLGLWQATGSIGAQVWGESGAVTWNELLTDDPEACGRFYTKLFGWTDEVRPQPSGDYYIFKQGDDQVAGMMEKTPDMGEAPSSWTVYFSVDNADSITRKCTEMGGAVFVPPMDIPGVGRFAWFQDPQGAVFAVLQPPVAEQMSA